MVTELYSRYGSRLTTGASEMLYDALLNDEILAPFFENIDMDALREHMADLLSSLTGGPEIYSGRSMKEAHAPFKITAYHFQRVADPSRGKLARSWHIARRYRPRASRSGQNKRRGCQYKRLA